MKRCTDIQTGLVELSYVLQNEKKLVRSLHVGDKSNKVVVEKVPFNY